MIFFGGGISAGAILKFVGLSPVQRLVVRMSHHVLLLTNNYLIDISCGRCFCWQYCTINHS